MGLERHTYTETKMTKITQKQLIESFKQMKEIKPRQEWASLLRAKILVKKPSFAKASEGQANPATFASTFSSVFFQRKMAYSFAALLFLVIGAVSFSKYAVPGDLLFPIKKIAEQSQANLTGQTPLNQDVTALNNRVNELAQVAKEDKTNNIPSAISEVTQAVKNLKNSSIKNSQTIKNIASSLKTLADVPGTDLSANSDVKDLYQTVVQNQIADLQKTTLTDDQKNILTQAENLAKEGNYEQALEALLPISN